MPDIVISGPWSTLIFVVWFVGGLCVIYALLKALYDGLRKHNLLIRQMDEDLRLLRRVNKSMEIVKKNNDASLTILTRPSSEGDRFLGMTVEQTHDQIRRND